MTEPTGRDLFQTYIVGYHDSIRDTANAAIARLTAYDKEDFSSFGETDEMVEGIDESSRDDLSVRLNTTVRTFASVFDSIHPGMMENDTPPDFFRDIIALLIETALQRQEASRGNITQLLPDVSALREHVDKVWSDSQISRMSLVGFDVYRCQFDGGIISISAQPEEDGSWKIGYERLERRVIVMLGHRAYEEVDGILRLDCVED